MINHHPEQTGVWFDYAGGRYKDIYDIRLKTGEVYQSMRPNGNSWNPHFGSNAPRVFADSEVAQIRLKPDSELRPGWSITGPKRIERTIRLFGNAVPPTHQPPSERQ